MKKLLLSAVFAATAFLSNGQCVINPALTAPGFYPDSLTGIPGAVVGTPYSTDIQFRVPLDTVVFGFMVPIDSMVITSVANLPTGFTVSYNPVNGNVQGNNNGCMLITGTATPGQETGGLLNDGVYNLIISYTLSGVIPFVGSQSFPQFNADYRLVITNPVGIKGNALNSGLNVYPNPASNALTVVTPVKGNYELVIYDFTGRLLRTEKDSSTGKLTVVVEDLENGNYYIVLKTGEQTVVQKVTVLH